MTPVYITYIPAAGGGLPAAERRNKMCKYCEASYDDGDYGECLIDTKLDFGILEDYLNLEICVDENEKSLVAYIVDSTNFNPKSEVFADKQINYCPMCGRKLVEDQHE